MKPPVQPVAVASTAAAPSSSLSSPTAASSLSSPASASVVSPFRPRLSAPAAVSFAAANRRPDWDLAAELAHNRDAYRGEEKLRLTGFPVYLLDALARLLETPVEGSGSDSSSSSSFSSPSHTTCGLSTALSCCISHGLEILTSLDLVQRLIDSRSTFFSSRTQHTRLFAQARTLFDAFQFAPSDPSGCGTRHYLLRTTEWAKDALSTLAVRLGCNRTALAAVCTMYALVDQPEVTAIHDYAEWLDVGLEDFLLLSTARADVLDALIESLARNQGRRMRAK